MVFLITCSEQSLKILTYRLHIQTSFATFALCRRIIKVFDSRSLANSLKSQGFFSRFSREREPENKKCPFKKVPNDLCAWLGKCCRGDRSKCLSGSLTSSITMKLLGLHESLRTFAKKFPFRKIPPAQHFPCEEVMHAWRKWRDEGERKD